MSAILTDMLSGYEYDAEKDVYLNGEGKECIINTKGNEPTEIVVDGDYWHTNYAGNPYFIDWEIFSNLPIHILNEYKSFVLSKLKQNAPVYIKKVKPTLRMVDSLWNDEWNDFSDLKLNDHIEIWQELNHDYRSCYREAFRYMSRKKSCGATHYMAAEIGEWKSRNNVVLMKQVTDWNPKTGAYTVPEWEKLNNIICTPYENLPLSEKTADAILIRAFMWLALLCGKRPIQLLGMKKDGIYKIGNEWFAEVRPAKAQAGGEYVLVPIKDESLINLFEHYRMIPIVSELQNKHDRLFVSERYDMDTYKELPTHFIVRLTKEWWPKHAFKCKRDNENIVLTTYRIRHTVATNLAMDNTPREIIAIVMEHDSNETANAYINACASRLGRELNKVDLNSDGIFAAISEHYFNGKVVDELDKNNSILVPIYNTKPLFVGSCSRNTPKDGICTKHPFLSCYTCASFRAWKDGEHKKAVKYIDMEIDELTSASESELTNRDLGKLRETKSAVIELIRNIGGSANE